MASPKLLASVPFYNGETKRFGRSFHREDVGFGKIDLEPKPAMHGVGTVWFYDLKDLPTVATIIDIEEDLTQLKEIEDPTVEAREVIVDIMEQAVNRGLAIFSPHLSGQGSSLDAI